MNTPLVIFILDFLQFARYVPVLRVERTMNIVWSGRSLAEFFGRLPGQP